MPYNYSCARRNQGAIQVASLPIEVGGSIPITVAGWVRFETYPLSQAHTLFSNLQEDHYTGVSLSVSAQGLLQGGYAQKQGSSSQSGAVIATIPITDTLWHYVAMTIDATGDIHLLVDGLRVDGNGGSKPAGDALVAPLGAPGTFIGVGDVASENVVSFASWSVWSVNPARYRSGRAALYGANSGIARGQWLAGCYRFHRRSGRGHVRQQRCC